MELNRSQLNHLVNLPKFQLLTEEIKTTVIKHFNDFKTNFLIEKGRSQNLILDKYITTLILCRKCLNAPLVDQTTKGMISHNLEHILDNLRRIGILQKLPSRVFR